MNLSKPNKNNTRKNLERGKHRKLRKIEKIFHENHPKLRIFSIFQKNDKNIQSVIKQPFLLKLVEKFIIIPEIKNFK